MDLCSGQRGCRPRRTENACELPPAGQRPNATAYKYDEWGLRIGQELDLCRTLLLWRQVGTRQPSTGQQCELLLRRIVLRLSPVPAGRWETICNVSNLSSVLLHLALQARAPSFSLFQIRREVTRSAGFTARVRIGTSCNFVSLEAADTKYLVSEDRKRGQNWSLPGRDQWCAEENIQNCYSYQLSLARLPWKEGKLFLCTRWKASLTEPCNVAPPNHIPTLINIYKLWIWIQQPFCRQCFILPYLESWI